MPWLSRKNSEALKAYVLLHMDDDSERIARGRYAGRRRCRQCRSVSYDGKVHMTDCIVGKVMDWWR